MGVGRGAIIWQDNADMLLIWENIRTGAINFKIVAGVTGFYNGPSTGCVGNISSRRSNAYE